MTRTLALISIFGLMAVAVSPLHAEDAKKADPDAAKPKVEAKPDAATTSPATQQRSRPFVRLSYVPGTAALPVLIGIERGFFAREGLTVSAVPVIDQRAISNSISRGMTDFVAGPQAWLLDLAHAGAPVKVVALSGYGREIEVIAPAWDKKSSGPSDLKDKTVLIVRGTHNFDIVPEFYRILAFSKMSLSSVKIGFIDLNELKVVLDPKFEKDYKKRNIGGIITYREYTKPYVDKGEARVIVSNEQITKLIGRISPRPLLANADLVKRDPEAVQRFVNAWAGAMKYIDSNPKDAGRILAVYYGRQYGSTMTVEEATEIVNLSKYDRVEWTSNDTAAANINAKAISAARNLLFSAIKDKDKRPFKKAPKMDELIETKFSDAAKKHVNSPETAKQISETENQSESSKK